MNRRLTIFRSFRGKLIAALLGCMLIPGVAGYLVYDAVAQRDRLNQSGYELERAGFHIRDAVQAVDEFANLAQRDITFFSSGSHPAIVQWQESIEEAHAILETLAGRMPSGDRGMLEELHETLIRFSDAVDDLPPLLQQRGLQDYGLAGDMREAIHALEDALKSPELMVHLLMIRRHEKDYIIRNQPGYIADLQARADELRGAINICADCTQPYKSQLTQLLDRYLSSFNRLVQIDGEIGIRGATGLYGQLKVMESEIIRLHSALTSSFASSAEATAHSYRERMMWIIGVVLLLAVVVSGYLAERLTAPLAGLSRSINRYVGSRFTKPVDFLEYRNTDDEVFQIAQDVASMQGAIGKHLGELEAQQRTLEDLNRELDTERRNLAVTQRIASLGYWRLNPRSGDFAVSAELRRLLEFTDEPLPNFRIFSEQVIHDDSRDQFKADLESCEDSGHPVQGVYRAITLNGRELWIRQYLQTETDDMAGALHLVAAVQNITSEHESAQEIRRLAYYDSLTGLCQRGYLFQRLEEMVRSAKRRGEQFALFFIDLDKFKEINDTLGHEAGDQLLIEVAQRLQRSVRESDLVARLGGDEFCVLLDAVDSAVSVAELAERLLEHLAVPVEIQDRSISPQASVGIAMYPQDGEQPGELIKAGDHAMYAAKRSGEHSYVVHEHEISAEVNRRAKASRELRDAFQKQQLVLHYQPMVDLTTGRASSWEALLRWQHPERGIVSAGEFIKELQRLGLLNKLGDQLIESACRQLAAWRESGVDVPQLSLNIAPSHLEEGTVAQCLERAMSASDIPSSQLVVEITEVGIQSSVEVRAATEAIRELGVEVAIDDFGTGYASLASLKDITVDCLKIDRTFVQHATSGTADRRLLTAIVELGRSFNYRLIAEGVETPEQLELLQALGCRLVQGFLFSAAVDPGEVPRLSRYNFVMQRPDIHLAHASWQGPKAG